MLRLSSTVICTAIWPQAPDPRLRLGGHHVLLVRQICLRPIDEGPDALFANHPYQGRR